MDEHDGAISFGLVALTVETLGGVVVTVVAGTRGSEFIHQIHFVSCLAERIPHSLPLGRFLPSQVVSLLIPISDSKNGLVRFAKFVFDLVDHLGFRSLAVDVAVPS